MTPRLSPMQSRLAALALLLLVLLLAVAAVAGPLWWLHRHYDDAISDATARITRYARIAGMRPGLQAQLAQVRAQGGPSHFLKATSAPLAAAEIQELAKTLIESSGGKLNTLQILPPKEEGGHRRIPVNVQLSGSVVALKKILHALESSRPYLFIDNFSVRSQPVFVPRAGASPVRATEPELFIQFDLSGYALKGTP